LLQQQQAVQQQMQAAAPTPAMAQAPNPYTLPPIPAMPSMTPQAPMMEAAPQAPSAAPQGLPPITAVQTTVAHYTQENAPVIESLPSAEVPTPIAPVEDVPASSRDLLVAKMKAFKESQDIKAKHNHPKQLSMNMEDPSLEEARRMAREVLSSPFAGQNLEVPAFIRKKQNFDLNKE
nr:cell division protein FtsZ [Pseudobdellovibrionaceae bacterium]